VRSPEKARARDSCLARIGTFGRVEKLLFQSRTKFRSAGKTQLMGDIERVVPTDADVVLASLTDPGAFAGLFDRHAGSVNRYVAKRVAREDAEDLVGETFATAFCSRERFDLTRPNARPWLFGIATNLVHHHWRSEERRIRRERAAHPIEPIGDPADEALSRLFFQGQAAPIARALARLDGASLDVLLLVAGQGLTYDEVAVALDVPVGTVRSRLARARRLVRADLGESEHYLDDHGLMDQPSAATEGLP